MTKRTREHELETESFIKFESLVPSNWVFRRKSYDYGIDGELEIFDDSGRATGLIIYIQLKSTSSKEINKILMESIKVDTLKYFSKLEYPVLIVKYSKHFDKIYFLWAHSSLMKSIAKNQKTTTVHFPSVNILTKHSFFNFKIDISNYISYHKGHIRSPFKLYLNIQNKNIKRTKILLEFKKFSELNDIYIDLSGEKDPDTIGQIHVNEESFVLSIGGGSATVTGYVADTPIKLLADLNFALAILLANKGLVNIASKLIAPVYKQSTFIHVPNMFVGLLEIFYKANCIEMIIAAANWWVTHTDGISEYSLFCVWLMKNYNKSNFDEQKMMEQLLRLQIIFYSNKNDFLRLGTAYYNIGNFYYAIEKRTKALHYYNKARKADSNYAIRHYYWSEIGAILFNSGKIKYSNKAYCKSLEIKDEGDTRARYADTLVLLGDYSGAQNEFKKYFEKCTEICVPFWRLKFVALKALREKFDLVDGKRNAELASKSFSEVRNFTIRKLVNIIKQDPLCADAWFEAGHIYHQNGEIENATYAYLWTALLNDKNLEAWAYAIVLSLVTPSNRDLLFVSEIITAAFERNGVSFLSYIDEFIDHRIKLNDKDKEEIKKSLFDIFNVLKTKHPFKIRLFDKNKEIKEI